MSVGAKILFGGVKMNKYKIKKKNGSRYFVIKSEKGQQLNMHEIEIMRKREIEGLFHVNIIKKDEKFKLTYNITGYISLREYLSKPMNKDDFGRILENIYSIFKSIRKSYFSERSLVLDFKYIFVNPSTTRIHFIYIPIQYYDNESETKDFFLALAHSPVFVSSENTDYVKEYLDILHNGINFSMFDLEEYIKKINGRYISVSNKDECPRCGKKNDLKSKYCSYCGYQLLKEVARQNYEYNPLSEKRDSSFYNTQNSSSQDVDETMILGQSDELNETTILNREINNEVTYPVLKRIRKNEEIKINKSVFRIGTDAAQCDYCIKDNHAVSRRHLDIICRNGRYYVSDNKSTNKSYLDGKVLPVGEEIEINDGSILKLADEEFSFRL